MGIRSIVVFVVPAFLSLASAGCGNSPLRGADVAQPGRGVQDQSAILRTVLDPGRDRIWTLSSNGYVQVHEARSKALLRQIHLSDWLAVKTPCMPDLIVDERGSAWVSSNVLPWIWRIAADTFQLQVLQVTMPGREGLDFGFGTLAFSPDGTLRGLSPAANSIWRIEQRSGTATMVHAYETPLNECRIPG
jgi:hypothetical protein